jgi:formylglycine-generating enzyme required for sulfatase activity
VRCGWAMVALGLVACGGPSEQTPPSGWTEPVTGMDFVLVPAGEFAMGFAKGAGDVRTAPSHRVRLTRQSCA